jgi:REP element-mobilizing transposase RayT
LGKYADTYWRTIPEHFPFIKLKNHIVMPNHVHGILVIDNPNNKSVTPIERQNFNRDQSNMRNGKYEIDGEIDSRLIANLSPDDSTNLRGGITGNHNPMLHENLSRVLRWYKGKTTFECRKLSPNFGWQARFYDHIIRNEESFHRISQYICNNPLKWSEDRYS